MRRGTPEDLARRITYERVRRGWDKYADLTEALRAQGVELPANAIGRIEKGKRAVSVHELFGLAAVFDVTAEDLLRPMKDVENDRLSHLTDTLTDATTELHRIGDVLIEAFEDLASLDIDLPSGSTVSAAQIVLEEFAAQMGPGGRLSAYGVKDDDHLQALAFEFWKECYWRGVARAKGFTHEELSALRRQAVIQMQEGHHGKH